MTKPISPRQHVDGVPFSDLRMVAALRDSEHGEVKQTLLAESCACEHCACQAPIAYINASAEWLAKYGQTVRQFLTENDLYPAYTQKPGGDGVFLFKDRDELTRAQDAIAVAADAMEWGLIPGRP